MPFPQRSLRRNLRKNLIVDDLGIPDDGVHGLF